MPDGSLNIRMMSQYYCVCVCVCSSVIQVFFYAFLFLFNVAVYLLVLLLHQSVVKTILIARHPLQPSPENYSIGQTLKTYNDSSLRRQKMHDTEDCCLHLVSC